MLARGQTVSCTPCVLEFRGSPESVSCGACDSRAGSLILLATWSDLHSNGLNNNGVFSKDS